MCVLLLEFHFGDFPSGPVVKTLPSNTGGAGSISGWGTKIPHAVGCGKKIFLQKV